LLIRGAVREGLYALALLTLTGAVASAQPVCPGTATLTVFVENLSGTPTIAVELDGELAADAATCGGSGATSYRETMTCTGSGVVRCGQLAALQPGSWVHRLSVTVPGSAMQQQAQRLVLVAGSPAEVSNALVWTVYPETFVVQAASAAELQARLDADRLHAGEPRSGAGHLFGGRVPRRDRAAADIPLAAALLARRHAQSLQPGRHLGRLDRRRVLPRRPDRPRRPRS